ncbi:Uncharacterized protein dnm_034220 [Desulfonema magnum]|uniref:Uncharacterized protein n=1 Tax=Desulfonema magnum TaxID=45655 RepID=A0A975GN50_9BACT|nr:Uncharacterized protein dnm_034220 [Desulfonema magnum]
MIGSHGVLLSLCRATDEKKNNNDYKGETGRFASGTTAGIRMRSVRRAAFPTRSVETIFSRYGLWNVYEIKIGTKRDFARIKRTGNSDKRGNLSLSRSKIFRKSPERAIYYSPG